MEKPLVLKGWDRDIKDQYESGILPHLMINMTKECNLGCIYCHTDAGEAAPDEIKADEWKRVINESFDLGNKILWIGGAGEPLLDNGFKETVEHAHSKGMTTILNTNGTLIGNEMARFLYEHNVSLEVKIATFNENVYDYLCDKKSFFPKMRQGLRNLLEAGYGRFEEREEHRLTRIGGMILLCKPAYESLPEVFEYCNVHNLAPVISGVVAAGRVVKNRNLEELKLTQKENEKLFAEANKIMGYNIEGGFDECNIQFGMVVQYNGDILVDRYGMSCDVCDYQGRKSLGNVRKISLEEGWKRVKEERERNSALIKSAYEEFDECPDNCFAGCPMVLQSEMDYFEKSS